MVSDNVRSLFVESYLIIPSCVLSSIPFGLTGAVLGHLIMGINFSVLSMMGFVALTGVVVNDSLVMVDFINRYRSEGNSIMDAVLEAGPRRFRPIFLTSLTTFVGLTPLLLEKSIQSIRQSLSKQSRLGKIKQSEVDALIQRIQPSMTLAVDAKAKELRANGVDIIGFGAGEPDFDTPDKIKKAGIAAIETNKTHYTPVGGVDTLKQAIVNKLERDNNLIYKKNQILVSCGAKHSLFNIAQVLWEEGDEIIVPAPYWVSYPDIIRYAGAKPVIIDTLSANEFKITPDQISSAMTANTRAIIINSPSNPTGSAYSKKELEGIAECALSNKLLIVSDEIYEKVIFDGFEQQIGRASCRERV